LLAGKPPGTVGTSLAVTRLSSGRLRPPVGWAALIRVTTTRVAFTISLLVACLTFTGRGLGEANLSVLCAAVLAPALTWMVICQSSLVVTCCGASRNLNASRRRRAVERRVGSPGPLEDQTGTISESPWGSTFARSRREWMPSLLNTLRRCHSTVRGLRKS
jgi:Na+/H+ antiporter 1